MPNITKKDMTDEEFEKHMHDGHRNRLLNTVHHAGLADLSPVQVLEFVLFYIFPRGDVNPLAHRLLNRFDNLSCIMEAPVTDLMKVKGMGETSARKLHALLSVFEAYTIDKVNDRISLERMGEFIDSMETLLRFKNEEVIYIFGVAPSGMICHGRCFARGNAETVGLDVSEINNYIYTFKVTGLIFAHNHPNGSCKPSRHDLQTFERLKNYLAYAGVVLHDSIIIGRDGVYSCARNAIRSVFATEVPYVESDRQKSLKEKPEK